VQKLQADRQSLVPPVPADWQQLQTDLHAVKSAKAGSSTLRSALKTAQAQLKQERQDAGTALKAARQAAQALRQSFKKK
jgi:hypothetical protein